MYSVQEVATVVVSYNTVVSAHLHSRHSRRRGVVVSGVPRVNEVNPRRARLVFGWATHCLQAAAPSRYATSQLDQLSFASGRGR